MGTEVLRPQDCLVERIRSSHPTIFPRRRHYAYHPNPNLNHNHKSNRKCQQTRSDQRRQHRSQSEPSISKRSSSDDLKTARNGIVLEKVTILRRGQSLDSKMKQLKKKGEDLAVSGPGRLGPDPEMVNKEIRYAGSAFAVSPAPSSLPLPSFSKKKQVSIDDSASRDLRRLLRIE